ncbi:uncharacterized protein LOC128955159 [Oppia nitens]|uniref:uncharacterized protein LOC128955159 n=1 Tax=Oppia nitens TaxID=1686743 RepID=UPI0023DA99F9|nr:uncharacterized protein LOC128955159 [Oppia nitens]
MMDSNIGNLRQTMFAKQLMAYFSDININTNRFIRDEVNKDNGWISFTTLMTFNRLKQLADNSYNIFVDIVKNLQLDTDFLEIDVINERVRRNPNRPVRPKTDEWIREYNERTVHLAGFPTATAADVTFDQLMQWSQTYGTVEWLDMRYRRSTNNDVVDDNDKDDDKQFKGCIYVTYETKAMADSLLGQEVVKYGDNNELMKENKLQYYRRKREFVNKLKIRKTVKRIIRLAISERNAEINDNNNNNNNNTEEVYIPHNSSVLMLKKVPKQLSYQSIRHYFYKVCSPYQCRRRLRVGGKASKPVVKYVLKIGRKNVCYVRFNRNYMATTVLNTNRITDDTDDVQKLVIDGHHVVAEVLDGHHLQHFWQLNTKRINKMKAKKDRHSDDVAKYQMTSGETCVLKRVDKRLESLKQSLKDSVLIIALFGSSFDGNDTKKHDNTRHQLLVDELNQLATVRSWIVCENNCLYVRFASSRMARNVLTMTSVDDSQPLTDCTGNLYHKMLVNTDWEVYARVLTGPAEQHYLNWSVIDYDRPLLINKELKRFRRLRR